MPYNADDSAPTAFPKPDYLTLQNFKRGVITLINASRLPKNALAEAVNDFLYEDGQPGPRPGIDWFGTAPVVTTTTSPKFASTAAGTNWTTPSNALTSNDTRAVFSTTTQNDLFITNFGLNLPTTATILGVQVYVEGNGTDATAGNRSIEIGMTKDAATLSGSRLASQNLNQTTDTTLTFGTVSNLFSTTLTVAEINMSNWGIMLRAANTNAGARNIDTVTIAVTYTNTESIMGYDYFDSDGDIHLVAVAGGYVQRSLDDGTTWNQCSASGALASFDPTKWVNMNQNGSYLYLTDGPDPTARYDGTTTLQVYTVLTTPTAPTVTKTGLATTTYPYHYKIAQVNQIGFTAASTKTSIATTNTRDGWDSTSNFVTVSGTVSTSATRVDVYISEDDLNYYYLGSAIVNSGTGAYTFKDDGTSIPVPGTIAPTDNTTQGPAVEELSNVGTRQLGVRDQNNRYRIWFSGTGNFSGSFSSAYDGGYLDWQPGGKLYPVKAVDYRSGKGDPIATIFMDSADGQGGIIQLSFDTLTIADISITLPSAYMLPGSRGTPAPGSVVNVLNDFFFYNSQAEYNLGTRAQFLNILSTDEASSNIRPNFRRISRAAESGITAVYSDANIYISVPESSDTNNKTIVYNTEMHAWLPDAFSVGFSKFLRYTDQNKGQHLLGLKPGDTRLSEISVGFNGDYGVAFDTSLTTGLYQTTNDRFEFQFTEEGEFELSDTAGVVNVELIGIDRSRGFRSIKTVQLSSTATVVGSGWDVYDWDSIDWDTAGTVPDITSELSLKRYFPVQKELNGVQWHIYTSNSVNARFLLRTLQTWGTPTQAGHPSDWRLKPL